ncbi:MAG: Rv3235 family protein [Marmoricola sp.]
MQPSGLRAVPIQPAVTTPLAQPQSRLQLDFGPPVSFPARPNLRLVTGDDSELDAFATRFAQAIVEVIGGDRSVQQLMRWTTHEVYDDLARRSNALQRTIPADQRRRRLRAQVRSVHLSRPQPDAAEVSIHVRHGQRSRAIAVRIERIESRWRCSAMEFG